MVNLNKKIEVTVETVAKAFADTANEMAEEAVKNGDIAMTAAIIHLVGVIGANVSEKLFGEDKKDSEKVN